MTTDELNREVARATGETVSLIRRMGFLLDDPAARAPDVEFPDLAPQIVNWDELEAERRQPFSVRPQ